jgi:hypothetical protein
VHERVKARALRWWAATPDQPERARLHGLVAVTLIAFGILELVAGSYPWAAFGLVLGTAQAAHSARSFHARRRGERR